MSTGQQDYSGGMQIGRITFGQFDYADPLARPTPVPSCVPGYSVETPPQFKRLAEALGMRNICWLIEVKFPSDERSPRYFTGECEPGWNGVTTIRPDLAQKYLSKEAAEKDIAKLAPRLIGEWVAREHGFS